MPALRGVCAVSAVDVNAERSFDETTCTFLGTRRKRPRMLWKQGMRVCDVWAGLRGLALITFYVRRFPLWGGVETLSEILT